MSCAHEDFVAHVDVQRIVDGDDKGEPIEGADLNALSVDVRVQCAGCGESLVFRGLPIGLSSHEPRMSPDGTEVRIPARPQSSDPHFGLGLPGFIARVHEGERGHAN